MARARGQISAVECHTGGTWGFATDFSWAPVWGLGWRSIEVGASSCSSDLHLPPPLTCTSLPRFQGQDLSSVFSIPATVPTCLLPGLSAAWPPVLWRSNGPLCEGHYSPGFTSFLPLAPGSQLCTILLAFPNSEFHDTVSPCHSSLGQGSRFHPIYRMRRQFRPGSHNGLCFLSSFFFIL